MHEPLNLAHYIPSIHSGCACTTYRLNNQNQRLLLVNVVNVFTCLGPPPTKTKRTGSEIRKKKERRSELHIGNIVATFSLLLVR